MNGRLAGCWVMQIQPHQIFLSRQVAGGTLFSITCASEYLLLQYSHLTPELK